MQLQMSKESFRFAYNSVQDQIDYQSKKNGISYYLCRTRAIGMSLAAMTTSRNTDTNDVWALTKELNIGGGWEILQTLCVAKGA